MRRIKSIKLYFFSILKIFFLSFRNYYFSTRLYNKKLITFFPNRIFYYPSSYLNASLISGSSDFYKIKDTSPELLWKNNIEDKRKFENLHNFLWLSKLDRKSSKAITQNIINSWINKFFNYEPNTWKMDIIAKRIISWASNTDLTLEDSDEDYKKKIFLSIIKQSNFILRNLNSLDYGPDKIICCAAIILSGIIFKENDINYKIGVKELDKVIKNNFDLNGFPKSRNTEEVFNFN